ncbi:MAG TPA: carboxypeptidase regulatory-like domain-containing protein [Candidatus Polarisedimenticolia bacterium]|nr:carboxypeptidase regulatory-like domain-containing protein [Candidatus Polarisedimenticolia bacterium]
MARRTFTVLASIFLILSQALGAAASGIHAGPAPQQVAAPIASGLIDELRSGARSSFVVEFAATTDLRGARGIAAKAAKGKFVYDHLTKTAAASQADALGATKNIKGVKATSYWLTNVLVVRADVARGHQPDRVVAKRLADLAEKLSKTKGVSSIRAEVVVPLVKPVKGGAGILAVDPEWGVEKIGAPDVWAEGITGAGIVVATIDTGVEYTHEALVEHYRGNLGGGTFDHNYNWWDPANICGGSPCDNVFHGTHTMGTIVGGDLDGPLPDIGVAPGAEWIAAKGCEDLGCSESSLLSSGQFMVAPTDLDGNNPDPSKAPDLVSNSWGNDDPNNPFYLETVQAWRAAGIIPVFAAGNAGPGCGSAGTPGNYVESISVGATDIDDNIAGFSSRGPSPTDKISPNVSGPGVDVVSSVPGNGYGTASGTSMATPHVAGTIALMMSADLALAGDFDAVLNALNVTAIDRPDDQCGSPDADLDPNFVYGEGRIDAKAAVDLVKTGGTLVGTVRDVDTSDPIEGARVTADNGERQFSSTTDENGDYELFLAEGTYTVSARAFGYETAVVFGTLIVTDETTTENFDLTALPRFTVSGTVTSSGSPVAEASVVALGTPVDPAITDGAGHYELVLPIGEYTLKASLGGCSDSQIVGVSSTGDDVVQDFALVRKVDGYGHVCGPIPFDWVDADGQTALFGDDTFGYLRMPFDFPFYGESYNRLFVTTNGFVSFLPTEPIFFPSGIPSSSEPNAAIYALWRDLVIDEDAEIDYATIGSGDAAAFVIEYQNARLIESDTRVNVEMKLWANGNIDLLYGDNPAGAANGSDATIGIEDQTGSDALQIGFFEQVVGPNSAVRIETLPVAILSGTVVDANDDSPISGASVTAEPSGRTATTDSDGHYELRLLAGSYDVTASKGTYDPVTLSVSLSEGELATLDFALESATASVEPTSVEATVGFGETAQATVRLSNNGSATLNWEAKERDTGSIPPDLPPAFVGVLRTPGWSAVHLPNAATVAPVRPFDAGGLPLIIDDDDSDSFDTNEITAVYGQSGGDQANIAIDFANLNVQELGGYMYFDVDQDPNTGLPAEALFGLPTQDVGIEYFVTFFDLGFSGEIPVWNEFGDLVGIVPGSFDGQTVSFGVPLEMLGGDDGSMNVDMVAGFFGPSDWAADEGHGTVSSFAELDWLDETPASGRIIVGGFEDVVLTLGGPTVAPGEYHGQVVFVTSAPKQPQVPVDVTLTVTLPDAFGRAAGTVTDAHTLQPVGGALVTLHATWLGDPLDFETTTADDGSWSVIGPEGSWPVDVSADGYVPASINATIVRGVTTGGADAAIHKIQPHAGLDDSPIIFVLSPDKTRNVVRELTNTGGHADLTFTIGEVNLDPATAIAGSPTPRHSPVGPAANLLTSRGLTGRASLNVPASLMADGDVLASWPAVGLDLPWGVGYNGNVWLSDPIDNGDLCSFAGVCVDIEFSTGGTPTGASFETSFGDWAGDMAFDAGRGLLWQVSVGGDNGIYGIDPSDGSVQEVITGDPWTGTSQRGLAYDPAADVFYIGGWNEGIIYRVAGPSHPTPGETLSQCNPADPNISGLAWNGSFQMLWEATNSDSDTIFLLDPTNCETVRALPHPDGGGFGGAGLETDVVGNLWLTGQNSGNAYLIESGLPNFSDVPWLSVAPTDGTVGIDGAQDLTITADSTGLASGVYHAIVVVQTNDPDHATMQIPVILVVPAYQQGINAGGGVYTTVGGDDYAADKPFSAGSFGWVGASSTRSVGGSIAGTPDPDLYRNLRSGMSAYRFSVPNGTYRVDLGFAELQARHAGDRVFSVALEGGTVLSNFDVFALAGGQRIALDRSFLVEVTDGVLDISFLSQRGDAPIINAIFVTEVPPGAPGG